MSLSINLVEIEEKPIRLHGTVPAAELELGELDEMLELTQPVAYDLEAQSVNDGILVQGELRVRLDCRCVRCLKPFQRDLTWSDWSCHLPLSGEDRVPVVRDAVDLTPWVREDILLALPQHPLCERDCRGLAQPPAGMREANAAGQADLTSPAWAVLNKLKL
jgi:uncharacterized protein